MPLVDHIQNVIKAQNRKQSLTMPSGLQTGRLTYTTTFLGALSEFQTVVQPRVYDLPKQ